MAKGNFDPCFKFTIGEEGRYSSTRLDRGNWSSGQTGVGRFIGTCWGISAPTLLAWVGPDQADLVTPDYMQNLPIETAKAIYLEKYWNRVRGDDLPLGLDLAVWDFGVNAGVNRSVEELQEILNVDMDGVIGPVTMSVISYCNISSLINNLIDRHDKFYEASSEFGLYGQEWLDRQQRLRTASLAMAGTSS